MVDPVGTGEQLARCGGGSPVGEAALPPLVDANGVEPGQMALDAHRTVGHPFGGPGRAHVFAVLVVTQAGEVTDLRRNTESADRSPQVDGGVVGVAGVAEMHRGGIGVPKLDHAFADAQYPGHDFSASRTRAAMSPGAARSLPTPTANAPAASHLPASGSGIPPVGMIR